MNVELEVIEKYTRSVKFNLKFDRYEVEKIIFIPIESSPMSIKEKLHNTIENLVSKTFIGDGRQEDMRQMYDERRKTMFSRLEKMVGKIKEIDSKETECNHTFKMDEVWDTDKIANCTKCDKPLTELTPKVKKK